MVQVASLTHLLGFSVQLALQHGNDCWWLCAWLAKLQNVSNDQIDSLGFFLKLCWHFLKLRLVRSFINEDYEVVLEYILRERARFNLPIRNTPTEIGRFVEDSDDVWHEISLLNVKTANLWNRQSQAVVIYRFEAGLIFSLLYHPYQI